MRKKITSYTKLNKANLLIIVLGSISWCLTMVKSGLHYSYGLGFWGPNGHDGVWHIALANSLSQGRFEMPVFGHTAIKNYHLGFDLILAFLHKITFLPINNLYFQVMPVFISIVVGLLLISLMKSWGRTNSEMFWTLFFIYFGSNFAFLIHGGESTFWSQQAISTLINPPFALSLVFILVGLILIERRKFICAGIIFGLLIQIKAYASIIILGSIFIVAIYEFLQDRKYNYFKLFFVSSLVSLILFLPFDRNASSLLEFKPFWFLETMMSFPDRVGWSKFGEAMVNYKLAGNLIKGIPAYVLAFLIFWYGNLGTRFIQELYWLKNIKQKKLPNYWESVVLVSILIGLTMSMLFVQKGTAWNTIQFFYYCLFFSSFLAGITFSKIISTFKNKTYKYLLIILLVIITIPTTIITLKDNYLPSRPPAKLSNEELAALSFLEKQPDGIVLTNLFDEKSADKAVNNPPRPLRLYVSTAYVAAYAQKPVFLEDEINLNITNFDWQTRRDETQKFFDNPTVNFLVQNKIKYLYLTSDQDKMINSLGLKVLFENREVKILEYE